MIYAIDLWLDDRDEKIEMWKYHNLENDEWRWQVDVYTWCDFGRGETTTVCEGSASECLAWIEKHTKEAQL